MPKTTANWSLYIIEASDASLYTGITTDVERRFGEHTQGPRGARYFNGRSPLRIIYREDGHDRASASRREAEIKKLSRRAKQQLIAQAAPDDSSGQPE
jgi:putative endonuclease